MLWVRITRSAVAWEAGCNRKSIDAHQFKNRERFESDFLSYSWFSACILLMGIGWMVPFFAAFWKHIRNGPGDPGPLLGTRRPDRSIPILASLAQLATVIGGFAQGKLSAGMPSIKV